MPTIAATAAQKAKAKGWKKLRRRWSAEHIPANNSSDEELPEKGPAVAVSENTEAAFRHSVAVPEQGPDEKMMQRRRSLKGDGTRRHSDKVIYSSSSNINLATFEKQRQGGLARSNHCRSNTCGRPTGISLLTSS